MGKSNYPNITVVEFPLNLKYTHTVKYGIVVMDKCTVDPVDIKESLRKMYEQIPNTFIFLYDISQDVKDCYDFSLLGLDYNVDPSLYEYKFYTVQPVYLGNMFNEATELFDKLEFIKDYTLKILNTNKTDDNETMEYVLEFLHYSNK